MKRNKKGFFLTLLALLFAFSFIAACGESEEETDPVVTLALNMASRTLYVGPGASENQKAVTLRATVKEDNVTKNDAVVVWSSSDPTKATVADGVVTAVAVGTATITATYGELTADCEITVEYVELITLVQSEAAIFVDMSGNVTFQIEASVTGGGTITYTSSNEAVATVDANGLVTGLTTGTASITVASAGANSVTCAITVTNLIEPYNFVTGNFATVRGNPGTWYWFTQGANIGTLFKLGEATFEPIAKTLKIDFNAIVNGWEEGVSGVKEYAFRIQPLLTENKAENVDIEYTFKASFVSDRTGKIAIYDRDFGMFVPDHEGHVTEDPLMTLDEAKALELSVTREVAAVAKGVDLEKQDLVKWYNVTKGVEVEIEFKGKLSTTDGALVVRPYMYSDFAALYPEATEGALGEMVDDPFYVMLKNMTFMVNGVEVDYRTGKVVQAA